MVLGNRQYTFKMTLFRGECCKFDLFYCCLYLLIDICVFMMKDRRYTMSTVYLLHLHLYCIGVRCSRILREQCLFHFFSSLKGQSAIQTKATKRLPSQCFCELKQMICTVYGRQLDLFLYTASDIFILL